MSDSTRRCWLVERTFNDRDFVTLVYATEDGARFHQQERSAMSLQTGSQVTAAEEIAESNLEAVPDEKTRERYASEVERVTDRYEPDDPI